ncbi:MAG: cytochrome c biogenesis protein CcdA [Spirochaetaceae bacterium]|nr:MAG: cytochrome c biogenesis protein CcdA [Spirochaetaceae bacterium]
MMSDAPTLLLAMVAGLLSFASPCVLPLIPSYLSYIGGVSLDELRSGNVARGPMLLKTVLFVVGFTLVFVLLGIAFSGSGLLFARFGPLINLAAGAIVILLGLNVVFDFWRFLMVERRVRIDGRPKGYTGSMLVGMAFGAGWTPCIGPILAAILFLAGQGSHIGRGALLLAAYSLGLGIPFLAAGFFFPQVANALQRIKRHLPTIKTASGLFLIAIGVLIAAGRFQQLNAALISAGVGLRRWQAADPQSARIAATALALTASLVPLLPWTVAGLRRAQRPRHSRPHRLALAVALLLLTLGVLQGFDLINLPALVATWLTYQGV